MVYYTAGMLTRRFGRTNLQMPVLSCGGMRYQQGWKDMPLGEVEDANQRNLEATIRRSVEAGINHIETARGYGSSERQLGLILPTFPREELIVQTKIGPKDDAAKFTAEFEDSLQRLQLDHVDLLSIHGINDEETLDQSLRKGGCLEAARAIQSRGLANHIGFSTHATLDILMRAITEGDAEGGFDYVNLHWYWIFQRNQPAIEAATQRDMGMFIISPSDKGGKLYDPPERLVELCRPLHPIVFNDLWCLQNPQVHTLSIGASKPSDFDEHLEAVGLMESKGEAGVKALLDPIVARLRDAMHEATGHANPEHGVWDLPDHRGAPEGMNLPVMLWLRNLAAGWGLTEYGKMRFNMLGNGGHWFPGAKPGEALERADDAALRDAADGHPLADRLPGLLREAQAMLGGAEVKRTSEGG